MAKYLIDGSTLTAIADAIRNNSPISWAGQNITPEMMPSAIEDCYYDGRDEGYAEGSAKLWGSYSLIGYLEFANIVSTSATYTVSGLYSYFYSTDSDWWERNEIDRIEVVKDEYVRVYDKTGHYNTLYLDDSWYDQDDWAYTISGTNPWNMRIVEAPTPVSVTQEFYDWFSTIVDNGYEYTAFELGNEIGWEQGYDKGYDKGWEDGCDAGYDDGYTDGYGDAGWDTIMDYAPFIIQGQNTPITVNDYSNEDGELVTTTMYLQEIFDTDDFNGEGIGYVIDYAIEYDWMISGSNLTVGFINYTKFTAFVFMSISYYTRLDTTGTLKVMVEIPPNSEYSWRYEADSEVSVDSFEVDGVRFDYAG